MSSAFKFTPISTSNKNEAFNQNIFYNSNLRNRINNNFPSKINLNEQNNNQYPNTFSNSKYNNIPNNQFSSFSQNLDEMNNIYNPCYILITKFDYQSKELLYNFISEQNLNSRDVKAVGNDKIIIKFQNQRYRSEFMDDYNKVKNSFFGVEIKFIDENEKERIINNNANRVIHNISYTNNYMNNMNNEYKMVQLPQNKSNFQKFLDVFFNL